MEKVDERVLAYKLAKEIDLQDLDEVSGGTLQGTGGPTGYTGNMDGNLDMTWDC